MLKIRAGTSAQKCPAQIESCVTQCVMCLMLSANFMPREIYVTFSERYVITRGMKWMLVSQ